MSTNVTDSTDDERCAQTMSLTGGCVCWTEVVIHSGHCCFNGPAEWYEPGKQLPCGHVQQGQKPALTCDNGGSNKDGHEGDVGASPDPVASTELSRSSIVETSFAHPRSGGSQTAQEYVSTAIYDGPMPHSSRERYALTTPCKGRIFVYTLWDWAGRALYVGLSKNPPNRFDKHQRRTWWPDVTHLGIIQLEGSPEGVRRKAEALEARLIVSLKPAHNVLGARP